MCSMNESFNVDHSKNIPETRNPRKQRKHICARSISSSTFYILLLCPCFMSTSVHALSPKLHFLLSLLFQPFVTQISAPLWQLRAWGHLLFVHARRIVPPPPRRYIYQWHVPGMCSVPYNSTTTTVFQYSYGKASETLLTTWASSMPAYFFCSIVYTYPRMFCHHSRAHDTTRMNACIWRAC